MTFYDAGQHYAIDLGGARAVFTTRRGGWSRGPYASLNLGRWTDDAPGTVRRNHESLTAQLGVGLAYGRQVHGTAIRRVDAPQDEDALAQEADGQATATPGVGVTVLTADCLPVAIAADGAVAMVHAGWRGLAGGVLAEGVAAVRALAGAGGRLRAAVGPGAGACCYEVGEDVHAAFAGPDAPMRRGRNLDLKAIARAQLERAGVGEIHDIGLCTICGDPTLFFSHRRDHGLTGRQAGVAWLS